MHTQPAVVRVAAALFFCFDCRRSPLTVKLHASSIPARRETPACLSNKTRTLACAPPLFGAWCGRHCNNNICAVVWGCDEGEVCSRASRVAPAAVGTARPVCARRHVRARGARSRRCRKNLIYPSSMSVYAYFHAFERPQRRCYVTQIPTAAPFRSSIDRLLRGLGSAFPPPPLARSLSNRPHRLRQID